MGIGSRESLNTNEPPVPPTVTANAAPAGGAAQPGSAAQAAAAAPQPERSAQSAASAISAVHHSSSWTTLAMPWSAVARPTGRYGVLANAVISWCLASWQAWVSARDYNQVRSELLESALADFQRRGLRSAQPPREVHLHHHNAPALPLADEALKPALPRDTTS